MDAERRPVAPEAFVAATLAAAVAVLLGGAWARGLTDRMQKSGQMQEAFRALKEFADLCPDQDDIRLLLAEQLTKADNKAGALEQLQHLYERYDAEGRTTEAQATIERMKAIDPNAEVRASEGRRTVKHGEDDLVFLDLNAPSALTPRRAFGAAPKKPRIDPSLPLIELDTGPVFRRWDLRRPPSPLSRWASARRCQPRSSRR